MGILGARLNSRATDYGSSLAKTPAWQADEDSNWSKENFLLLRCNDGDNNNSALNADNSMTRFMSPRWICFLAVALLCLSALGANADPVGDFFKRVGQSISKAFHAQPPPRPARKTTRGSRELTSNAAEAVPTPPQEPSKPTRTVLPASAAPAEKAKGDMPYGIPVPGQKDMVTSPYLPEANYIDVSGFAPGSAVRDPYTGKIFRVP
jgi:hypothetical protein